MTIEQLDLAFKKFVASRDFLQVILKIVHQQLTVEYFEYLLTPEVFSIADSIHYVRICWRHLQKVFVCVLPLLEAKIDFPPRLEEAKMAVLFPFLDAICFYTECVNFEITQSRDRLRAGLSQLRNLREIVSELDGELADAESRLAEKNN